jgi:hypothetical protein
MELDHGYEKVNILNENGLINYISCTSLAKSNFFELLDSILTFLI